MGILGKTVYWHRTRVSLAVTPINTRVVADCRAIVHGTVAVSYSGNPNNAEVDSDGRIFLGSDLYGTATDVWVHDSNGSLLTSYELSGPYSGLIESSLMISGDGLRAITNSDRGLITTIGP
jgi:hypothetical protein